MCEDSHTHTHTHTHTHPMLLATNDIRAQVKSLPINDTGAAFELRIRELKPNRPYWSQITPNYRIAIILSPGIVTALPLVIFFLVPSIQSDCSYNTIFEALCFPTNTSPLGSSLFPATHSWAWSWLLSPQSLSVPQCHIPPALSWSRVPHGWTTLSSLELKLGRILAHHHHLQILFLWGAFEKWLWRGSESSCCLIYKPVKIQKDWLSLGKCPEV